MKHTSIIGILLFLSIKLIAQDSSEVASPQLQTREVSGVVKNVNNETVIGATVILKSSLDSVKTITNEDGIFVFKNVKLANFNITVQSMGSDTVIQKYLNSPMAKIIVLDPIVLKTQPNILDEVIINGKPSITYKTDTIEYRANDYKTSENATIDELLGKMEGMEVNKDGVLTYQGQQVTKARVNGKDFAGGDVAQAILNLPADIVDKAQIINDYGDEANRTGIKDGTPAQILNLTTKMEKSIGNILRTTAVAGSNDRYDGRLFAQRLNANRQLGFITNIKNTINGVADNLTDNLMTSNSLLPVNNSGTSGFGNGGTTTSGNLTFNYRDQWKKFIQVNASYQYGFNKINSINNSIGEILSSFGTTSFTRDIVGYTNGKSHNVNFELEYLPDSSNFVRITNIFKHGNSDALNYTEYLQSGLQNQYSNGTSSSRNITPNNEIIVLYQYLFKKNRSRNLSVQFNFTHGNQQQNNEQNLYIEFRDPNQNGLIDSLTNTNRSINRGNLIKRYRLSFTYVEPVSKTAQFEFNAQTNYRGYENNATTSNINPSGLYNMIDSLSNIYSYSFTESRISLNYRLNKKRYNLSIGIRGIPTHLTGNNISKGTIVGRSNFYLIPLFRLQYQWSSTQQLSVDYSGNPIEPSFNQIQPIPDYSDAQNPIFGNSSLKPMFTNSISTRYNNYIANLKLNLSASIRTSFYHNQVKTNVIQIPQLGLNNYLNEIHYVNLNGSYSISGNYSISKHLSNRRYSLNLNGTVLYDSDVGMSNNALSRLTMWRVNVRFGPKINPNQSVEINPFILYNINRAFNSVSANSGIGYANDIRTGAINIEGKFNLPNVENRLTIEYSIGKNYVSGIAPNVTTNPFVANAYIEKVLFKKKNGVLRLSAFDIFDQNNFINHIATTTGYMDAKTNILSRYFSVSFILNFQKWTGATKRSGDTIERRGDGSFIY